LHPSKMTIPLILFWLMPAICGNSIQVPVIATPFEDISSNKIPIQRIEISSAEAGDGEKPGADGLGDSLYPNMGNGGYDVQHYTLNLDVKDVNTSDLCGKTTIEARAVQSLSSFNLDFLGFTIQNITVDQQPARFERHGQELVIIPAAPIADGKPFTIEVSYCGKPQENDSIAFSDPVIAGWATYDGGSFVLSQPDGAATYYPVNDHPLDKATYTFYVTVPSPYEVVANGDLTETMEKDGEITYVWEAHQPMASYLTTVDIGEFDLETGKGPNGIPIRNYYSKTLNNKYRQFFIHQSEMMALFNSQFGAYPFDVYGSIVLDAETESALETQTISIFGADQLGLEDVPVTERLVAHELAHQWFGDSISLADWSDIWLNEGLATYAEGLWVEHTDGPQALEEWVNETYKTVVDDYDSLVKPGKPSAKDLFNEGVYLRGALTWHALRLEIGDKVFFEFLHTYFDRFKGGNARTKDIILVAEEVSGKNLASFFNGWLYGEKLPTIPTLKLEME
jgi:aminopeptidase N